MTSIEQHGITAAKPNAFGAPKGPAQFMGDGAFLAYMGQLFPTSPASSTAVPLSVSGIETDEAITAKGQQAAAGKSDAEAESVPLVPDALSVIASQPSGESPKPPASDESFGPAAEEQTTPLFAPLIPAPNGTGSAPYLPKTAQISPHASGIEPPAPEHQQREDIGQTHIHEPDKSNTYTAVLSPEKLSISDPVSQPEPADFSTDASSQTARTAPVAEDSAKMAPATPATLPKSAPEATSQAASAPITGQAWPISDPVKHDHTALAKTAQGQGNEPPLKASANTDLPTTQPQSPNLPLQPSDSRDAPIVVRTISNTGDSSESSALSLPAKHPIKGAAAEQPVMARPLPARETALTSAPQVANTSAEAAPLGTENVESAKDPAKASQNQPLQNAVAAVLQTPKAPETGHVFANSPDTASTPAAQISKPQAATEAVPYSDVLLASNSVASHPSTPHSVSVAQAALHQPVPIPALAEHIKQHITPGKPASLELSLAPEELGKMRMVMTPDGDKLRIVIQAERPETLELLRRNTESFSQDLRQSGYSSTSFSFSGWGSSPSAPPPQKTDRTAQSFEAAKEISAAPKQYAAPLKNAGLDLRF